jgi:hypothetical protein
MFRKKSEKLLEQMIERLYDKVELPLNDKDPINKEVLNQIIKNIAMEIVKAQSIANQAMY